MDVSKCDVQGILCLSDDLEIVNRANELAKSYNVSVVYKILNTK